MTTKNAILRLNYTPREAHQLISFLADLQDLLIIHFNDRLQQQTPEPDRKSHHDGPSDPPSPAIFEPDFDDPLPPF